MLGTGRVIRVANIDTLMANFTIKLQNVTKDLYSSPTTSI